VATANHSEGQPRVEEGAAGKNGHRFFPGLDQGGKEPGQVLLADKGFPGTDRLRPMTPTSRNQ
jgi:hypothetical protein